MNELIKAIDIYPTCDGCFRGPVIYTLQQERRIIGSEEMTPVRVCEKCYEMLGRPALSTREAP